MRGMAHIGVLRALKTLGIEFDVVVGTSIGALVGAMVAIGGAPTAAHGRGGVGSFTGN